MVYYLKIFKHKIVYLVYRIFNVYFSQGGAGLPCPPFSALSAHLFCRLPALPLVVGGGGRVYVGDWGFGGSGLVV